VVTHQLQVERRTGKVRRPETDVLPLCQTTTIPHYNSRGDTTVHVELSCGISLRCRCRVPGLWTEVGRLVGQRSLCLVLTTDRQTHLQTSINHSCALLLSLCYAGLRRRRRRRGLQARVITAVIGAKLAPGSRTHTHTRNADGDWLHGPQCPVLIQCLCLCAARPLQARLEIYAARTPNALRASRPKSASQRSAATTVNCGG